MQTLQNDIVVPTNSDPYNLTDDLAAMGDSANVIVGVQDKAARDALVQAPALTVFRADTGLLETSTGSGWVSTGADYRKFVPGTAAGTLNGGNSVNLGPTFTVPSNLFGPGVPYEIQVDAQAITSEPAGTTVTLEALLDLLVMDGGRNQKSTPGQTAVAITGSQVIENGAAKTVTVRAVATGPGAVTFIPGVQIGYYRVKVSPVRSL